MNFDREWAAHKEAVLSARQSDMRLNAAAGGEGSADGDLKTNGTGKGRAASHIQDTMKPETRQAATYADEETTAVGAEFKGWQTGSGLDEAHEEWKRQVASLQSRLSKERDGFQKVKRDFQLVDHEIEQPLSRIARLGQADDGGTRPA
ncbi:hypothetical protein NEH83_14180 [Streptomyces sp. JUS-F4]|uniref:hypothetical protein n=1 Tax=Streptomyces TaxID=1883 RepID=UPI0004AB7915|nr:MULTISPECIES: hypothetical protein [Streptomyces]WKN19703.1 hypothetical protein NEH83_14180 [Streptomyces sp. JUS-F4]